MTLAIDLNTIITTLLGAIILYAIRDNTTEKKELKKATQDLREDVLVLKTQVEPIKDSIHRLPVLTELQKKMQEDLQTYFGRLKKVEKKLGVSPTEESPES